MPGPSNQEYRQYAADFQFAMDSALSTNPSEPSQLHPSPQDCPLQATFDQSIERGKEKQQQRVGRRNITPQGDVWTESMVYYEDRTEARAFAPGEQASQPTFETGKGPVISINRPSRSGASSTYQAVSQQTPQFKNRRHPLVTSAVTGTRDQNMPHRLNSDLRK